MMVSESGKLPMPNVRGNVKWKSVTDAVGTVLLSTRFPCCGGSARLAATLYVPRETYTRVCSKCGARFEIERKTPIGMNTVDGRIDMLDWILVE